MNVTFKKVVGEVRDSLDWRADIIGSEFLRLLSQAGVPARAHARNPTKGAETAWRQGSRRLGTVGNDGPSLGPPVGEGDRHGGP